MSEIISVELKSAAKRCDGYLKSHNMLMHWELDVLGLKLVGINGPEQIVKYVDWPKLENTKSLGNLLANTEKAALIGLSD